MKTSGDISVEMDDIRRASETMIKYLNLKVQTRDWRSVAEAANDIRELEYALKILGEIVK